MAFEEIKRLQTEGKSDEEIREILKGKGLDEGEISRDLSHLEIQSAVNPREDIQTRPMTEEFKGMQPSILTSENAPSVAREEEYQAPVPVEDGYNPSYPPQEFNYGSYSDQPQAAPQFQQYSSGVSSDTITEIADQIVSEKTVYLKNDIERMKDISNTIASRMEFIDERLKRIEKIIDRLQLSILQKVGEYVTNVDDIKKELIETQKSFKSLLPRNVTPKTDIKQ